MSAILSPFIWNRCDSCGCQFQSIEETDLCDSCEEDRERRSSACRCARCIAPFDCPSCQAVNGLCKACEDHYAALAALEEA